MRNTQHLNEHDRLRLMPLQKRFKMVQVKPKRLGIGLTHDGLKAKLDGWRNRCDPSYAGNDHFLVVQTTGGEQRIVHQEIGGRSGVVEYGMRSDQPGRPTRLKVECDRPFCQARIRPEPFDQAIDIVTVDRVICETPSRIERWLR